MARKRSSAPKHTKVPLIWFILAILALAIPLSVIFSQQKTSFKQEAAGKKMCAQVLTPARNKVNGKCKVFSNACLPKGWVRDSSCKTAKASPTIIPDKQFCAQVITAARDSQTGACQLFPDSCLPDGWVKDSTCAN